MSPALLLAACLLILAILLIVGWPMLMAVPGRRLRVLREPEARFVAGAAASLAIMAALAPLAFSALISGYGTVQVFASDIQNLSFGR